MILNCSTECNNLFHLFFYLMKVPNVCETWGLTGTPATRLTFIHHSSNQDRSMNRSAAFFHLKMSIIFLSGVNLLICVLKIFFIKFVVDLVFNIADIESFDWKYLNSSTEEACVWRPCVTSSMFERRQKVHGWYVHNLPVQTNTVWTGRRWQHRRWTILRQVVMKMTPYQNCSWWWWRDERRGDECAQHSCKQHLLTIQCLMACV